MPILMPKDTHDVLGDNAQKCDSRSLFFDRFADPEAKDSGVDSPRLEWFKGVANRRPENFRVKAWTTWIESCKPNAESVLYAQLQSRLIVNMAGGVMENAGLCLDRFGIPFIPGAAVKGCARRVALSALDEWCREGRKPGCSDTDEDNVLKPACDPFSEPAEMLAAIARIFGWVESDWKADVRFPTDEKTGRVRSDLAWACGEANWESIRHVALQLLNANGGRARTSSPSKTQLTTMACSGQIAFLPALPVQIASNPNEAGISIAIPQTGDLELDVVTCHHRAYYAGQLETATDTEEPNPVVFPTVAPGHLYAFKIATLAGARAADLTIARSWLACGLSTLGLGAKTHAGYGWFDTSPKVGDQVNASTKRARQQAEEANRLRDEELRKQQWQALAATYGAL